MIDKNDKLTHLYPQTNATINQFSWLIFCRKYLRLSQVSRCRKWNQGISTVWMPSTWYWRVFNRRMPIWSLFFMLYIPRVPAIKTHHFRWLLDTLSIVGYVRKASPSTLKNRSEKIKMQSIIIMSADVKSFFLDVFSLPGVDIWGNK